MRIKIPQVLSFNFFSRLFFSKFELPNAGCGSPANAAYLPLFAVFLIALLTMV